MSHIHETDEWLTCPYDKNHRFPPGRLQPHILKCKKSHPELASSFVVCKYNATHLFLGSEIEVHEKETCPDRHMFKNINNVPSYKLDTKGKQDLDAWTEDPLHNKSSTSTSSAKHRHRSESKHDVSKEVKVRVYEDDTCTDQLNERLAKKRKRDSGMENYI